MLFIVVVLLAIVAVAIARYIETSWLGRGLRAIRDNEEASECTGVPTLKLKLIACAVSGALMSAAGAPLAMYQSFVEPASAFNLTYSVSALAMPIVGGTSHWIGPVIGAILLGTVQQVVTVTISSELNVLVVGVLLVLFVVAAPEGIVGLARRFAARLRKRGS
jgi:branched-chain amino acid transport system permease protein